MKLPEGVISISLFLCEKTLTESDGVMSAIRIVDYFPVRLTTAERPLAPVVRIFGCAFVKGHPGPNRAFKATFRVAGGDGQIVDIGPSMDLPLANKQSDKTLPIGGAISIELNIEARTFGTSYLCFYLGETEVARTPFTIVPLSDSTQQAK